MRIYWSRFLNSLLFLTPDPSKSDHRKGCVLCRPRSFETALKLSSNNDNNVTIQSNVESENHTLSFPTKKKKGPAIHPKKIRPRLPVLAYHSDWVCINKPAGMTVHRSQHQYKQSKKELVVTTTLKRQLSRKVFPIHRLDHRTSGALLLAFSSESAAQLHQSLRNNNTRKTYIALLRGNWNEKFNETAIQVDKPLGVNDGEVKQCLTVFTYLACTSSSERSHQCTLVSIQPRTGRTHQIRRHAFALGMPVLGDTQHGDTRVNRWWRTHCNLNRLALHCLSLDLMMNNDARIEVIAPLPDDLRSVLERDELQALWKTAIEKEPRLATDFIDYRGGTLGTKKKWQRPQVNDML